MNIIVTGGAGFIGSNFVRLTSHMYPDVNITVIDKLTYAADPRSLDGVTNVKLTHEDINTYEALNDLMPQADLIVHFAAESHNDNSLVSPKHFLHSNVDGTFHLLEAVRHYGVRMHHVSTDEVYGSLPLRSWRRPVRSMRKFHTRSPYQPSSPYSGSKAASDMLVMAWAHSYRLPITISHASNNFGPYQHVEKFIPRTITNMIDGIVPRLYGNGQHIRDWIHVDDHNRAIWDIINKGKIGEKYHVSAHCEKSNIDIARHILHYFHHDINDITFVQDRPGHDIRYSLHSRKLRKELGWKPRHVFEKSLNNTIDWYIHNESWWRNKKEETEKKYISQGH